MASQIDQRREFVVIEGVRGSKVCLQLIDGVVSFELNPPVLEDPCIFCCDHQEALSVLSMASLQSSVQSDLCQTGSKLLESTKTLYDGVKTLLQKPSPLCKDGLPGGVGLYSGDSHEPTAKAIKSGPLSKPCPVLPHASQAQCANSPVQFGDDDSIVDQFDRNGFVVVEGVFSRDEISKSVDELWHSPWLLGRDPAIKRDDPSTWGSDHWPQTDGDTNFLAPVEPYLEQAQWELAQHPNAVHVVRLLWKQHGVEEVCVPASTRFGVMRPAASNPSWRTKAHWLHWDQNPNTQPDFDHIQVFACLSDQTETTGGLLCVPGFHKQWRKWGEDHPQGTVEVGGHVMDQTYGTGQPFLVPLDDPAHHQVVRVLAPAGALVLWDSRLPHQNFPNSGSQFRMVLYLTYLPFDDELMVQRRKALRRQVIVMRVLGQSQGFWPIGLSALGRRITGTPDVTELALIESQISNGSYPDFVNLARAIKLCHKAGLVEMNGDSQGAVELQRRAEKTFEDIMSWHEQIYA